MLGNRPAYKGIRAALQRIPEISGALALENDCADTVMANVKAMRMSLYSRSRQLRAACLAASTVAILPASAAAAGQGIAIEAEVPNGPLRGTIEGAEKPDAPVVLIIPGSGPTDRDGNSPLGIRAQPYRLLAQALAARGIVSVRIDKRGMFGSAGSFGANAVTLADYAGDVKAWVGAIRKRTGAGCVWLIGHSEGGLVALAVDREITDSCGLVLVSTAGRRLGDVLRRQLRADPATASLLADAERAIAALEAGHEVDVSTLAGPLRRLFAPQVQGFLVSVMKPDPTDLIRAVNRPVLILQGADDIQVSVEDARRLAAAQPAAKLVILPGVNHVLKKVRGGDRTANIATYRDPALPLAPGVAETIADFIDAHSRR
jgi:pimeloyl-ACP methyl ester carboxylesterase